MLHKLLADVSIGGFSPPTPAFSAGSEASGKAAGKNLELFLSNIIGALTIIAALSFLFYFVTGALNWISAGGDQGKISKARDQMVQGVIGMIVIVLSYALIGIIGTFLGVDILHPSAAIQNLNPLNAH